VAWAREEEVEEATMVKTGSVQPVATRTFPRAQYATCGSVVHRGLAR